MASFIRNTTAVLFLLVAVLSCLAVAEIKVVDETNDNISITTDHLEVIINGGSNVPKFSVRHMGSDPSTEKVYKVQMQHAFQTTSADSAMKNKVPDSETTLPSLTWEFSTAEQDAETLHFNITSSSSSPQFQFRVHINDIDASIKFDTLVNGMVASQWKDTATHYAICYKVIQQEGKGGKEKDLDTDLQVADGREMTFGDGHFEIEGTAEADKQIAAKLSNDASGSSKLACVTYEKWTGDMVHDPTLGVSSGIASAAASTVVTLGTVLTLVVLLL